MAKRERVAHDFTWAMAELKEGNKVRRRGWPSHHSVEMQYTPRMVKNRGAVAAKGEFSPATVDLFADDWEVIEE